MSSLTHRLIRLPVRIDRADAPVDADTGGVVRLWSGSPARLRLAFFAGDTLLGDFSGCSGVTVQLKTLGPGGAAPLPTDNYIAEAVVTEFNTALTPEEWEAGTAWHAEVAFAGDSINYSAGSYWLVAVALLDQPTTLLAGKCEILQDGYGSGSAAPTPPAPPYTRAESDARYLPATALAPSGQDATANQIPRGNAPALVHGQAAYDALAPVRTLVAQGKTRRLLVPGALATAPLVDSGYDIARDGSTASSTELVTGGDWRLGVRGGGNLRGDAGATSGWGVQTAIPLPPFFEIAFLCRHTAADKRLRSLAAITTTASVFFLNHGHAVANAYGIGPAFSDNYPGISPDYFGAWVLVSYGYDAAGWFLSINGSVLRTNLGISGTPVSLDRMFGGIYGGYGQFGGDIWSAALFSRPLSDSERLALRRGEWSADMARRALDCWSGDGGLINGSGWANPPTSASFSGGTLSLSGGAFCGVRKAFASMPAGTRFRVSGNLTASSGMYIVFRLLDAGGKPYDFPGVVSLGAFSLELAGPVAVNSIGVRCETVSSANSFTIANLRVEALGCCARWDPLGCSPSSSWRDSSGNGRHLRSPAGVTALEPRPQTVRIAASVPASTIPGVGNASGLFESDLTLTADATNAPLLGAIKAGDTVDLRLKDRLPNGMFLKQGARVVSDGLVVAGVMNLNGSDESTGTLAVELTHHL